ncbi:MAG: hypothetical protein ABJQ29_14800 [Luteolibacter sp.]
MKRALILTIFAVSSVFSHAQTNNANYTNFIRQVQLPANGVQRDASVDAAGQQESPLEINPGGARFELHTVRTSPFQSYLLDTRYVGTYVPMATVSIVTEDTNSPVPRTRADRGFTVNLTVSGLLSGSNDPEASKSVKFYRHVQSYGTGNGTNIDRTQATLNTQVTINQNGSRSYVYALSSVPGSLSHKLRGEERFSVFTLPDYQVPASQLASQTVQIWPVADGTITGITSGQVIKSLTPQVNFTVNDIYPSARVYAHVYPGAKRNDGFTGTIVPGSALVVNESVPQNRILTVADWSSVLGEDGQYTMDLVTSTVFGIDRLASITFTVDRTISVNGTVTTIE